jgi:hypothetical protein
MALNVTSDLLSQIYPALTAAQTELDIQEWIVEYRVPIQGLFTDWTGAPLDASQLNAMAKATGAGDDLRYRYDTFRVWEEYVDPLQKFFGGDVRQRKELFRVAERYASPSQLGNYLLAFNQAVSEGAKFDKLMRTYWDKDLLTPLQKQLVYEKKEIPDEAILWLGLGYEKAPVTTPKKQVVLASEFENVGYFTRNRYYTGPEGLRAYHKATGEWVPVTDYTKESTGYVPKYYTVGGKAAYQVELPDTQEFPSEFTKSPLYQIMSGGPLAGTLASEYERAQQLHGYAWKPRAKAPVELGKAGLRISTLEAR